MEGEVVLDQAVPHQVDPQALHQLIPLPQVLIHHRQVQVQPQLTIQHILIQEEHIIHIIIIITMGVVTITLMDIHTEMVLMVIMEIIM